MVRTDDHAFPAPPPNTLKSQSWGGWEGARDWEVTQYGPSSPSPPPFGHTPAAMAIHRQG